MGYRCHGEAVPALALERYEKLTGQSACSRGLITPSLALPECLPPYKGARAPFGLSFSGRRRRGP